ncbi:MAG: hypothetical protein WCF68_18455 [Terriglobales bacterium]
MAILALAVMAGPARAQNVYSFLTVHPYVTRGDLAASRFWSASTIGLIALDGAAKAADSFATRENIARGGEEHDPLARPFVHTTGVEVVSIAALYGAEIAAVYLLHRRHHDNMGRSILIGGAVMNGLGAAASFKNRVKGW